MRRCFICKAKIEDHQDCYRDHDKRDVCVSCAKKGGVKT